MPFIEFVEYNNAHSDIKNQYHGTVEIIEKTKNFILKYYHYLSSFSLEDGKLGSILFLAIYTLHKQDNEIYEYVNQYIAELIQNDSNELNLYDMLDLGWTLSFLLIKGIVKLDVSNEVIERIIDKINLAKENVITDFVLFNNALRLLLAVSNFSENIISIREGLLNELYNLCKEYCTKEIYTKEIFEFILYMEEKIRYIPSIYDIATINIPLHDYNPESYNLGISGCAGIGIKLMIDNYE